MARIRQAREGSRGGVWVARYKIEGFRKEEKLALAKVWCCGAFHSPEELLPKVGFLTRLLG